MFLYCLSIFLFFLLKLFGGSASFFEVRLALFWSLSVSGPLLILNGLLKGFFLSQPFMIYVSLILQALIAWIISSMLVEAEKFNSRLPTFAVAIGFILVPQFGSLLFS